MRTELRENNIEQPLIETQKLLRQMGVKGGRRLGQNFLVDRAVLRYIFEAAALELDDIVIEVGPGPGLMTAELVKLASRVIAVELDDRLAAKLGQSLNNPSNLTVINDNVLNVAPEAILAPFGVSRYKVVANLPYYITSPILRHFLEAAVKPDLMVIMVQKEVGETIVAMPGEMSILSVSVQFYGRPAIVTEVPARSFYPEPKVDSVVLKIDVFKEQPVEVTDTERFFNIVKAGFSNRRKQLRNSIANGLNIETQQAVSILEKAGIDPGRRAQTISLEEWARLESAWSKSSHD